jgi:hypothetical protein
MIELKLIEYNSWLKNQIPYYDKLSLFIVLCPIVFVDIEYKMVYLALSVFTYLWLMDYLKKYKIIGHIILTSKEFSIRLSDGKTKLYDVQKIEKIKLLYGDWKGSMSNSSILFYVLRFGITPNPKTYGKDGIGTLHLTIDGKILTYIFLSEQDCYAELTRLKSEVKSNGGNFSLLNIG